ncbi:MAG: glyoxylate/hydroxypyruvate reductase A [Cyanobacteria bacterium P01_A01_bin.105]
MHGHPPIPLLGTLSTTEQTAWLAALRAALPTQTICTGADVPAAVRSQVQVAIVANPDPDELALFPHLQWVQSLWAGVERLLATPAPYKIVRMTDPQLAHTMAEAVLAWTLYLHRDMPSYRKQQQERVWQQRPQVLASDRTVGLLGLGKLGQAAAQRLGQQGFRVCGWRRSPSQIDGVTTFWGADGLTAMLRQSHILVCLLPLTAATKGLLDATALDQLPQGAALINFARGPIIVTEALLAALNQGHLSHAVLDVFEVEPLPSQSPLWQHPAVTILPHISAITTKATAAQIAADNIQQFLTGGNSPPGVNRTLGY